jgi:hypothetical protein
MFYIQKSIKYDFVHVKQIMVIIITDFPDLSRNKKGKKSLFCRAGVIGQCGFAMRDTLMRDETSSGERLRMGILGILGDMGTPGVAGLQVKGV